MVVDLGLTRSSKISGDNIRLVDRSAATNQPEGSSTIRYPSSVRRAIAGFIKGLASYKAFFVPHRVVGEERSLVEIDLYGKRLSVFQHERRGAMLAEAQQGLQENLVDLLTDISRNQAFDYFLDVGANYGEFSCAIGTQVPQHILFEPHPRLANLLATNFAIDEHIAVENVAISNFNGMQDFYFREGYLGASSLSPGYLASLSARRWGFRSEVQTVRVSTRTLDSYKDEIKSGSNLLIKVDVEGYEYEVLEGLRELLLAASTWIILLEFNPVTLQLLHEDGARRIWNNLPSRRGIVITGGERPTGTIKEWEESLLPDAPPDANCDVLLFRTPPNDTPK